MYMANFINGHNSKNLISSNLLHSIRTSICIRKCNKNWGSFFGHFLEKSMGYSTVIFSDFGQFLKVAITQKI